MNKKYLIGLVLFILVGLFICHTISFAMEIQYPEVNGITITDETTPTVYILYFFSMFLALGGVIAFLVIISASVKFMMAGGEPSKVSEARNQIIGALIGLVVLYSSYMILNTINKNLVTVDVTGASCDSVQVCIEKTTVKDGNTKTTTEMSVQKANNNLDLKEGESIFIKKYVGLKEIWGFTEAGFKGTPIIIYEDTSRDQYSEAKDIALSPTKDGINLKSYKIIDKIIGIYLYDKPDFKVGNASIAPFPLTTSIDDFNNTSPKFLKAQSAESIANEEQTVYPQAIFFSEPKFRGYCSVFPGHSAQVSTLNSQGNNLEGLEVVGGGTFGNDNLASAVFYHINVKARLDGDAGEFKATLYSDTNCNTESEQKSINSYGDLNGPHPIGQTVKSLRLDGRAGVVLIQGDRCQYFSPKDFCEGNCICSILESDVPNPDSYAIFPIDN